MGARSWLQSCFHRLVPACLSSKPLLILAHVLQLYLLLVHGTACCRGAGAIQSKTAGLSCAAVRRALVEFVGTVPVVYSGSMIACSWYSRGHSSAQVACPCLQQQLADPKWPTHNPIKSTTNAQQKQHIQHTSLLYSLYAVAQIHVPH